MKQSKYFYTILIQLVFSGFVFSTNWYVSNDLGSDNLSGENGKSPASPLKTINYSVKQAWAPGDTIFIMEGVYRNAGYGNGSLSNGLVAAFWASDNLETSEDNWLVITNYPGHSPKIQFDGEGGITINNVNYIDISGLEIEGPNQSITKEEAEDNRLSQDKKFTGRGIAIWRGHHIKIHHMKVHDCPNSGIRVNNGDYIDLSYNEVYNNTWWSSNAESAIVVAQAKDFDTKDTIKIRLTNNIVHHNRNYIPYYNPTYGENENCYGNVCQDYIIDGSGVYITRNNPGSNSQSLTDYVHGWFYFANNITYQNGINGLTVHHSDRTIVTNNLAFMNGAVPLSEGRQNAGGITINGSSDVYVYNNISWVRLPTDFTFQTYEGASYSASNNIGIDGNSAFSSGEYTAYESSTPFLLFEDTASKNFHLVENSIAINTGIDHENLPPLDIDLESRDGTPDIGPYEYQFTVSKNENINKYNGIFIYPNPTTGIINLKQSQFIQITDISGKLIFEGKTNSFDLSNYESGLYMIKSEKGISTIIKK